MLFITIRKTVINKILIIKITRLRQEKEVRIELMRGVSVVACVMHAMMGVITL